MKSARTFRVLIKTNLENDMNPGSWVYVIPHIIVIKNNKYLMFYECDNVHINTLNNKISFKDLDGYIKIH